MLSVIVLIPLAAVFNTVFGLIVAWTLVKYEFPGKWLLDGLIELPFALPTAVAGITLSKLYSDSGFFGKALAKAGIHVAYTQTGIVIALIFVGRFSNHLRNCCNVVLDDPAVFRR